MSNVIFIPPPAVREQLLPAELWRQIRRIDHWRNRCADGLARLGGDDADYYALDEIADRLRARAQQTT